MAVDGASGKGPGWAPQTIGCARLLTRESPSGGVGTRNAPAGARMTRPLEGALPCRPALTGAARWSDPARPAGRACTARGGSGGRRVDWPRPGAERWRRPPGGRLSWARAPWRLAQRDSTPFIGLHFLIIPTFCSISWLRFRGVSRVCIGPHTQISEIRRRAKDRPPVPDHPSVDLRRGGDEEPGRLGPVGTARADRGPG